jgi:hypothetical protein
MGGYGESPEVQDDRIVGKEGTTHIRGHTLPCCFVFLFSISVEEGKEAPNLERTTKIKPATFSPYDESLLYKKKLIHIHACQLMNSDLTKLLKGVLVERLQKFKWKTVAEPYCTVSENVLLSL